MFNPCVTHSLDTSTNNIHYSSGIIWLLDILTYYLSNLGIDVYLISPKAGNRVNLNLPIGCDFCFSIFRFYKSLNSSEFYQMSLQCKILLSLGIQDTLSLAYTHIQNIQIYHAEVGCLRKTYRSGNLTCPSTGIFRKYPTSSWYICIITLPI